MPTLTRWYERRAKDCVQAAGRTDNPKHRDHLLNLAYEWAQACWLWIPAGVFVRAVLRASFLARFSAECASAGLRYGRAFARFPEVPEFQGQRRVIRLLCEGVNFRDWKKNA